MSRLFNILKIRPGEERMSVLLAGLMLLTTAGSAVGGNAIEALFFARFGVGQLPTMYIILGLVGFTMTLFITALMGRVARHRLYTALPIILGFLLVGEWLLIPFNWKWFFAVMWMGMNVINSLQGLMIWGLAGAACDIRQSKRLFPLFGAGGILGTVVGGFITPPLAAWLHSENLLLLWAGVLLIAFILGRALTSHIQVSDEKTPATSVAGIIEEMQRGYQFVRRSQILQWVSYSAVLFSVCFYSLALPFSRGVTAQFPDADRLAGFLGLFQSLSTAAALLASLLLANRLFARFGILPMLLLFPVIYAVGFGVLAIFAPFALLVGVRFVQMAYMLGIASTAWQALFNVVPPERRDQVRAFVGGVPEQAGTFLAGLILLVGERALRPQQLYLIGFAAAALLVYILWRASRAYGQALVAALRAGQPQLFFSEEEPFSGPQVDAAAVSVAVRGLSDPDVGIRRVSAEIAGRLPVAHATPALIQALSDDDSMVRAAAVKGLANAQAAAALLEISACLTDPDPEVRCQAIDSLGRLAAASRGIVAQVEPLLSDEHPSVRFQAAATLLKAARHTGAVNSLYKMAMDTDPGIRARALNVLGEYAGQAAGDGVTFDLAAAALDDAQPVVRRAASGALVAINPAAAAGHLIRHLDDDDPYVRRALAEALGRIGEPALESLMEVLSVPSREDGALLALEYLPALKMPVALREYAQQSAQAALKYHDLANGVARAFERQSIADDRLQLLIRSLHDRAQSCGINALRALGLVTAREMLSAAVENLGSRQPAQRANALETLDAAGEREIIRPLLPLWETAETAPVPLPESWLLDVLDDPDPWLRSCAVLVAAQAQDEALSEKLKAIRSSDPDEYTRAAAEKALMGGTVMETLVTLSVMERILFLRRVPLFADLPPADLKQVASAMKEVLFVDGQVFARQGEPGSEMFIVVSGEVRVLIAAAGQSAPREVAIRRSGDFVGEMSIFIQEPRIATLIAVGEVRALCLNHRQFEHILRERPETSLALMRALCQRLKEASVAAAQ